MRLKLLIFSIFTVLIASISFGQNAELSLQTRKLIKDLDKYEKLQKKPAEHLEKIKEYYPLLKINGEYYIGAIIKVNEKINSKELEKLDIQVNTKTNKLWSVKIPIDALTKLTGLEGIELIQTDTKLKKKLNNARSDANVDDVHTGTTLNQPYLGDGVIIGVIDFGFDYTHPQFRDNQQTTLRISRVWNMPDNSGTPPSGFNYGTEIVGTQNILNAGSSSSDGSHGTHVAGIAGGSGVATSGAYVGVAPNSELVFCHLGGGASGVVDAVNYIFAYASSVGKPVVINMSLGTHIGPHDGTSLQDQMFNSLSGPGRILVGAAGNEGSTNVHASKVFNNDTTQTLVYFEDIYSNSGSSIIDIW